jgi:SAM-dependent methyltransferase
MRNLRSIIPPKLLNIARKAVGIDQRSRALTGIDTSRGRGLEIGALNRPLLPRSPGRVFFADHCSTERLKEKYADNPDVPQDDIYPVDFDLSVEPLSQTNKFGDYDYVVASHVIEHVPDLIGWLRDIERILTPGGILALVIPDKRYCFDIFRRETSMWMIEEAIGRTRPAIETVIDHFVNNVEANTRRLWNDYESRHEFRPAASPLVCSDLIRRHEAGEYIDAHCWVFTPSSFTTLIEAAIGKFSLGFELSFFEPTSINQLEFYVQMRRRRVR